MGLERLPLAVQRADAGLDLASVESGDRTFLGSRLRAPLLIGRDDRQRRVVENLVNRNTGGRRPSSSASTMMLGIDAHVLDDSSASGYLSPSATCHARCAADRQYRDCLQLNEVMVPDLVKALDRSSAPNAACTVHANPLQEAMQHKGDTDFSGSISLVRDHRGVDQLSGDAQGGRAPRSALRPPPGWWTCPIAAVDVAGAGRQLSMARVRRAVRCATARSAIPRWPSGAFRPLQALLGVRHTLPDVSVVASGGIRTGMDAAKALAMGADAVSVAQAAAGARDRIACRRCGLAAAVSSRRAVGVRLHGCGAADLAALRRRGVTPAVICVRLGSAQRSRTCAPSQISWWPRRRPVPGRAGAG